ncbi:MAG: hypothetical protein D6698_04380 [Gammaproteobacteria bacterium]|nr:MAG: hypothetical protein D6698_04380 [Gammaproteobacteria bacterium]
MIDTRELQSLLEYYHAQPRASHPATSLLQVPKELEDLYLSIACLIDLPDDGRLFHKTRNIARLLVNAWAACKHRPGSAIVDLLDPLYASARPIEKSLFGTEESNSVYAWLHKFGGSGVIEARHRSLIPYLLRRINLCCRQVSKPSNRYRYHLSLAARKILVAVPQDFEIDSDPDLQTRMFLATHAQEYAAKDVRLVSRGDITYIKDLLLRNRKKLGRSSGGGEGKKTARWRLYELSSMSVEYTRFEDFSAMADPTIAFLPDQGPRRDIYEASPSVPSLKELQSYGESIIDYEENRTWLLPAHWFQDPWVAMKRHRGMQESCAMMSKVQPWHHKCLSPGTIQRLVFMLREQKHEPALGVIALALLCGYSKASIEGIQVVKCDQGEIDKLEGSRTASPWEKRFYDPDKHVLWWINPRGSELRDGYLPVSTHFRLSLPEIIERPFPKGRATESALFDKSEIRKAMGILKRLPKDGLSNVTLNRLRYTFEGYFVGAGGLPEILADHIQARSRMHLRSQHYYITFDWERCCRWWLNAVDRMVHEAGHLPAEVFGPIAWGESKDRIGDARKRIGAVGTPDPRLLQETVSDLLNSFPRNRDQFLAEIKRDVRIWNDYMAYLYLLMAVTTGRRPQRDAFPSLDNFNLESGRMFIEDKFNQHFAEQRMILMCPTLHQAIAQYRSIHDKAASYFVLNGFSWEISVNIPFLVEVDEECGKLVGVNPNNIERLSSCPWSGIKNGPRHYLLSRLHEIGVPQEAIDFLSGHRHEQREPEMSASPISWDRLATMLAEVIEDQVVGHLRLEVPFVD